MSGEKLGRALDCFLSAYQAQPELMAEQRGWSPIIALRATDTPARIAVALADGRVAGVGQADGATLEITGELQTLCDVLELRRDPNEPYLFGELMVRGAEADFLRLDYIASRLCPR
jgi:hypothetical protein